MNKKNLAIYEKTKTDFILAYIYMTAVKQADKVTVTDVIKRSGYNRTTFYRYFKNIYSLRESVDLYLTPCMQSVQNYGRLFYQKKDVSLMAEHTVEFIKDNYEKIRLLNSADAKKLYEKRFHNMFSDLISESAGQLSGKDDDFLRILKAYIIDGSLSFFRAYIQNPGEVSREELSALYGSIAVNHLRLTQMIKEHKILDNTKRST